MAIVAGDGRLLTLFVCLFVSEGIMMGSFFISSIYFIRLVLSCLVCV